MNKKTNITISCFLVIIGIIIGVLGVTLSEIIFDYPVKNTTSTDDQTETILDYLSELIKNKAYYYQNDDKLLDGALFGIISSLGDPYSQYLSEDDYADFNNRLHEKLYGIGVGIVENGSYPLIYHVYDNSPAKESGLRKGDTIITVDGVDIKNKTLTEISKLIKGTEGTKRKIGIIGDNLNDIKEIEIEVGLVNVPTVSYEYLTTNNHKIGYVKINSFMQFTYEELQLAMNRLEEKKIDELIIDVRNNPGGLLNCVTDVLDYFLNTDEPFMYSKTNTDKETAYYIKENNHQINYDIIVLINELSASASEIFAASMNQIGGYNLIGEQTFGKGTMQVTYPLNSKGTKYAKLTTEIWLTPNKDWIHDIGVAPTIEVDQTNYDGISYIDYFQVLEYDVVNNEVKDLQNFLNTQGYFLRTDGYYDLNTKQAVTDFQTINGLTATGDVDYQTAYLLNMKILNYLENKLYDNQFQKALELINNN